MWMYLYYTKYLENVSTADRTDHQTYLYEQWIINKNPAPFPIMRATVLESSVKDTGDVVQGIMQKLATLEKANTETKDRLAFMINNLRDKVEDMRTGSVASRSSSPRRSISKVEGTTATSPKKQLAKVTTPGVVSTLSTTTGFGGKYAGQYGEQGFGGLSL